MDYFIVTGASRGLGAEMVRQLMQPDTSLFCVARTVNPELIAASEKLNVELHWIQADLSGTEGLSAFMREIAETVDTKRARRVCLINNAASLEPIGPVGTLPAPDDDAGSSSQEALAEAIARSVGVNLIGPMLLTHLFVAHFGSLACERVVINISSGAAFSPMPGLSTYCTTKAGLNMFTAAAAADDNSQSPIRFYSVSPGTVDTDMQRALRTAGPDRLRHHATYTEWKESGALVSPVEAARRVLSLLSRASVENGSFVHARDLE